MCPPAGAHLPGGTRQNFGRLFKNDLKIYVYPMRAKEGISYKLSTRSRSNPSHGVKERPGIPSLEDSANLPDPDVLAVDIVEDLETTLQQFVEIAADLRK